MSEHPARLASQRSMAAVEAGDREAWLALFTDDAVVEDPIGVSPLNPGGEGRRGKAAIAGFWDEIISLGQVRFRLRESYACGDECANVGRISTTMADGTTSVVEGVYTYRVAADGRLVSLRAFWEFDDMQFESGPAERSETASDAAQRSGAARPTLHDGDAGAAERTEAGQMS